ncbi:transcriptional regulator, GntR family [Neorhodopirellula lusitana]|uniref:Transcriptional regulator, GntR family n=2 Tax=Neorhodopirellula lusitana TaxID=445327 RepID=A0ABY1QAH8_9BACT|nr:transcriptional regulator, GntR family [Neorhodopirellula lusitana]
MHGVVITRWAAIPMFFHIDPSNGQPIYAQVVQQVKFAIAEQTLRPGQLLPSVRQLSHQLACNPNTIARAFQELQAEELIETLRGRGVAVTTTAPAACRKQRRSFIAESIRDVLADAMRAGMDADEIQKVVDAQLRQLAGKIPPAGLPPD